VGLPTYEKGDFDPVEFDHAMEGVNDSTLISARLFEERSTLNVMLTHHDISAVARLTASRGSKKEVLGYMLLGPRKSGKNYDLQDAQVIDAVASTLVIAMQNALHFEEIQHFNVTLQERVEEQTRKYRTANEKLKKLDETKDEFISMASHQLRTPLTSVKGYLSMVLEGDAGPLKPQQEQLLKQSFMSSQRMVNLIADLLNLSRLNTGKFVIETAPTDLRVIVDQEIAQLHETAKAKNITLTYVNPKTFSLLPLDEGKIHQVVMNFIDNAIYYTPEGGQIEVSLNETPSHIEFRVQDSGIGVPREMQHKLFGKFYRADNARRMRPDGTGLGLYMAKKVVVAQGGSIIFASQEGKGSTFGFRFSKRHVTTHNQTLPSEKA
jgi:signal transduction histidine kinase